ncbi:3-hexulose-6-phosphate isomerase [Cryobacterium roopkundense]|uniref:3-hexulose-6-phosphate isomerase n=1 Tax=Cryobacterium roopkundense TaxID=1001240 RepID=A0A099JLB9_9MICO|nr:6-phospho-3-hexuloisomerase [Cryobacterium roopkundense]KGJ79124.1 3-hexulose-6-phosphate isomerase [Cryobacterium roopkundense]MBB5643258.1 6-phospho-3-hexuloisomerase [Cryobacterium roopkundense]
MNATTTTPVRVSATDALGTIGAENVHVVDQLRDTSAGTLDAAAERLQRAERVFVLGAGRSGLALKMTAMRLMHLGLDVHVVGEVTAPAITRGDVLLVASGSGTTGAIVRAAEMAATVGVGIVALTTDGGSPLARLAEVTVVIPAAAKQDHGGPLSEQYSGGLFEQSVLLVGDALFHTLWKASGATAEELWPRHANLE